MYGLIICCHASLFDSLRKRRMAVACPRNVFARSAILHRQNTLGYELTSIGAHNMCSQDLVGLLVGHNFDQTVRVVDRPARYPVSIQYNLKPCPAFLFVSFDTISLVKATERKTIPYSHKQNAFEPYFSRRSKFHPCPLAAKIYTLTRKIRPQMHSRRLRAPNRRCIRAAAAMAREQRHLESDTVGTYALTAQVLLCKVMPTHLTNALRIHFIISKKVVRQRYVGKQWKRVEKATRTLR
jgi:hypothetical protein